MAPLLKQERCTFEKWTVQQMAVNKQAACALCTACSKLQLELLYCLNLQDTHVRPGGTAASHCDHRRPRHRWPGMSCVHIVRPVSAARQQVYVGVVCDPCVAQQRLCRHEISIIHRLIAR
jgi:hypothetical protein